MYQSILPRVGNISQFSDKQKKLGFGNFRNYHMAYLQKAIVKKIIENEAGYVLALKGNQGTLHEDIKFYFSETSKKELSKQPFSYYKTFDKDHGRIEQREY